MAAVNRRVTLGIFGDVKDLQGKLNWVKGAKNDIERNPATVKVNADTNQATSRLDDVRTKLAKLSATAASFKVDADDKDATAKIAQLNYKLGLLDKKVSQPRISLQGLAKAEADLALLDASMSKIASKSGEDASSALSKAFEGGIMSPAGIGAAIAAALALAPGAFALAGAAGAVALGAAFAIKGSPALQAAGKTLISGLTTTLTQAAQVLVEPMAGAFQLLSGELPVLRDLLSGTFTAVAPLIRPMVTMLTDLVNGVMPGFNYLLRSAQAPLAAFFSTAGKIVGTGLGQFFRSLAPGVAPSLSIITSLLRILSTMMPVIGGISSLIAIGLAPAFRAAAQAAQAVYNGIHLVQVAFAYAKANIPGFTSAVDNATRAQNNATGSGSRFNEMLKRTGQTTAQNIPVIGPMIGLISSLAGQHNKAAAAAKNLGTYQVILGQRFVATTNPAHALAAAMGTLVSKINQDADAANQASQAWQKYIGIITGSFGSLQTLRNDLSGVTADMKKVKGSFDGSSGAALQYRVDLGGAINDAGAFIGTLRQQAAAAGNTRAAQNALSQGIKGTIAQLIPAASRSAVMRDAVLALARQNGIGATTFGQLTKMVGGTTHATDIQTQASNALSRMTSNATGSQRVFQSALQDTIHHLGLSKSQADQLTKSIHAIPANKQIAILEQIKGTGNITVLASGASQKLTFGTPGKGGHAPGTGYATGGYVSGPGSRTSDSVPAMLSNGEYVIKASAVSRLGTHVLDRINHYAGGGLVNNSQSGAGVAAGNLSLISDTVNFTKPAIKWATQQMLASVIAKVKSQMAAMGSPINFHGGAGVNQWRSVALQALALNHEPASLIGNVLKQMQTESGGNPNAINLTDSNAKRGDPSKGLMQVIGSTFRANHVAGTSWNIYDPLANIAAAIRYAIGRYGPSLMSGGHGMGSGTGYDTGGILPPGKTLAVNNTGHNEYVVNPALGGLGGVVNNYVTVKVDGHALASKQEIARTVGDAMKTFQRKGGTVAWA